MLDVKSKLSVINKVFCISQNWITSVLIHEVCKNLIATDISLECITRARSQYPEIRFETLDAFNIKDAMKFSDRFSKNCVVWKKPFMKHGESLRGTF